MDTERRETSAEVNIIMPDAEITANLPTSGVYVIVDGSDALLHTGTGPALPL